MTRAKTNDAVIPSTTEKVTKHIEETTVTHTKIVKPAIPLTADQIAKHIEEAAYYRWLNRGYLALVSDELDDWIEAEKEIKRVPLAAGTSS